MKAEQIDYHELKQILNMPYKRKFKFKFPYKNNESGPTVLCYLYIIEPKN